MLEFFGQLPCSVVAMEGCGGSHFWGREISKLGHQVRLIPPAYLEPFVMRQENDAADAEAIREAILDTMPHEGQAAPAPPEPAKTLINSSGYSQPAPPPNRASPAELSRISGQCRNSFVNFAAWF